MKVLKFVIACIVWIPTLIFALLLNIGCGILALVTTMFSDLEDLDY